MSPSLFTEHRSTCDVPARHSAPLRPTGGLVVWLVGLLAAAVSLLLFTDQSVTVLSPPSLPLSSLATVPRPLDQVGFLPREASLVLQQMLLFAYWLCDCQNTILAFTAVQCSFWSVEHLEKPMPHLKCRDATSSSPHFWAGYSATRIDWSAH